MMRLAILALAILGLIAATPLMDWPDLLGRPMPHATERIAYGKAENQFADLWLPGGPRRHPVVVMVHGGCWRAGVASGAAVIEGLVGPPTRARPEPYADASPAERLPIGGRQEIVNGADDPIAPPWLGRAWADKARAAGDRARFTVIPATGHVELIAPGSAAWSREADMIERLAR